MAVYIVLLTIVHVIVCAILVLVVLLQSGKAADLAGAFGGMGSQTAFGPRGAATALSRMTTFAAAAFMLTSLSLSILSTRNSGGASSVLDKTSKSAPKTTAPKPVPQPVTPGATPTVTLTPESGPDAGKAGKPIPITLPGQGTPAKK